MKKNSTNNLKIKIITCLETIALCMFFLFIAAVFIAANLYNIKISGWNFHSKFSLIFTVVGLLLLLSITNFNLNITKKQEIWFVPMILFVFSFIIRYYVAESIGINTHQISDYEKAFQFANPIIGLKDSGYEYFPTWGFYALTLKGIFAIFGYSEFTGIITNVLLQSISVVILYWLVYLVMNKVKIAVYAALVYALWPIHIFYNIVLSTEHFYIFFNLLALFLMVMVITGKVKNNKMKILMMGLSGCFLGFSGLFKALDRIALIAMAIVLILYGIRKIQWKEKDKFNYFKSYKVYIAGAIFFTVVYFMTGYIGFNIMENEIGVKVNRNPMAYYLAVGMNEQRNDWNGEAWEKYRQRIIESNYDYKEASRITYQELFQKLENSNYLGIHFFQEKFLMAWVDSGYFYWVTETVNEDSSIINKSGWTSLWFPLTQYFWIIVTGLGLLGTIGLIVSKDSRNYLLLFSVLVIIGFALLSLFIDVQPRYKCILYPQFSILAGYGYFLVERILSKIKVMIQG